MSFKSSFFYSEKKDYIRQLATPRAIVACDDRSGMLQDIGRSIQSRLGLFGKRSETRSDEATGNVDDNGLRHARASRARRDELGRATWTFLHTLAAQYPERPTSSQKKDVRNLASGPGTVEILFLLFYNVAKNGGKLSTITLLF